MSDANAIPRSRSLFGILYLVVMFLVGVLIVYALDASRRGNAVDQDSGGAIEEARPRSVASADLSESASDPNPVDAVAAETHSLTDQLAATQQRVQSLEQELTRLRQEQADALASERQRVAERLAELAPVLPKQAAAQSDSGREEKLARIERDLAGLQAERVGERLRVSLAEPDLKFAPGEAEVPAPPPERLIRMASVLSAHPDLQVRLRGHTDSTGAEGWNLALSQQRALAVRDSLVSLGVAEQRIQTEGAGSAEPVDDNATAVGRQRNRRVDILLTLP